MIYSSNICNLKYFLVVPLLLTVIACSNNSTVKEEVVMGSNQNSEKIRIYNAAAGGYETAERIVKSDEEWKKILSPALYHVAREHGTERPFCELPNKEKKSGLYTCAVCGTDLFVFDTKFESGTGWPSFYEPIDSANVGYTEDNSFGMRRVEVHCARCEAHLGHVFEDGPPPTHKRFCINSVSLRLAPLPKEIEKKK